MIGVAKTVDEDDRNEFGFPSAHVTAHERSNQTTHVDQSVNKALPWVAFSWFLSGGALVGLIVIAILVPSLIDSGVAKGVAEGRAAATQEVAAAKTDMFKQLAEARSEMAQQLADTRATANAGREHARIALAEVQEANAQLKAKGLISAASH